MASSRTEAAALLWNALDRLVPDWTGVMMAVAQRERLSLVELQMLLELSWQNQLRVNEMAARTGLSMAAASQMVNRMVERGFFLRQENQRDRREKFVSLSPEGSAIVEDFQVQVRHQIADALAPVSSPAIEELTLALTRVLREVPE